MNLTFREARKDDFPRCWDLFSAHRAAYDSRTWAAIPALWERLTEENVMSFFVVEDADAPPKEAVKAFSNIVFVEPSFIEELKTTLPPYVGAQLITRILDKRSPLLDEEAIGRGNAGGGLCTIVLQGRFEFEGLTPVEIHAVHSMLMDAFQWAIRGYRLAELLLDPYGNDALQFFLRCGMRLRRDYSDFYQAAGEPIPPDSVRPYLMSITAAEAHASYGQWITMHFAYSPPSFDLRRSQRRLLQHALRGDTDEELASALGISSWTIKKTWQDIYAKVAEANPALLPPPLANADSEQRRGSERRRRLLQYVREHPVEIRPYYLKR
jgi:DNA-binding CsgD family transcriptional regulator